MYITLQISGYYRQRLEMVEFYYFDDYNNVDFVTCQRGLFRH